MSLELIMKCWSNFHFYMYWCMLGMFVLGYIIPPLPKDYWDKKSIQKSE